MSKIIVMPIKIVALVLQKKVTHEPMNGITSSLYLQDIKNAHCRYVRPQENTISVKMI